MLQVFNSPEGQEIRVVDKDGEPWFVAKDVAVALDYSDTQAMTRRIDSEDVSTCTDTASGQVRHLSIINESGLYASILGSMKPEAKAFKRWVTHEVLPSIRKTGSYHTDPRPNLLLSKDPMVLDRLSAVLAHKARLLRELVAVDEFMERGELPQVVTRSVPASSLEPKVTAWVQEFVLPDAEGQSVTTTRAVMEGLGLKASRSVEVAVGRILHGMGFERVRVREDGVQRYLYRREKAVA